MMQMNGMGAMGPVMMIVVFLVWALVIGAVVWLVWRAVRRRSVSRLRGEETPETILEKRYARGEIDRATYERMRDELGPGPASD